MTRRQRRYILFLVGLCLFVAPPAKLNAEQVCLQNGDCLNGEVVERAESSLTLQHPSLGTLTIPMIEIAEPELFSSDQMPSVDITEEESSPEWRHRAYLGVSGEEGNDVSFLVKTGFSSFYEDDIDRWDITARYLYETEDREKDSSEGYLHLTRDWLNPGSPSFYYAQGRYHYDSFEYWEHRLTAFVGPGYEFRNTDTFRLLGRTGLGGSKTWGVDKELYPEWQLELDTIWRPNETNELSAQVALFIDMQGFEEFRTFSKLEWRIKTGLARGLSVLSSVRHEYDTEISPYENEDHRYDLDYSWGIELEF